MRQRLECVAYQAEPGVRVIPKWESATSVKKSHDLPVVRRNQGTGECSTTKRSPACAWTDVIHHRDLQRLEDVLGDQALEDFSSNIVRDLYAHISVASLADKGTRDGLKRTFDTFPLPTLRLWMSDAEQCWTRCCCQSPRERAEWARRHRVVPPSYAILTDSDAATPRFADAAQNTTPRSKRNRRSQRAGHKETILGHRPAGPKVPGYSSDFSSMPWVVIPSSTEPVFFLALHGPLIQYHTLTWSLPILSR